MTSTADDGGPAALPDGGTRAGVTGQSSLPEVARAVEALEVAVADVTRVDPRDLPSAYQIALLRDVEAAARRLAGAQARLLACVETGGLWAAEGARSFAAWVRTEMGTSAPRATALTRTARALRDHLPLAAAALAAGQISAEHAQILARHATGSAARIAALDHPDIGQAFLVEQAATLDGSDFTRIVRAWAVAADPESADRSYADDLDREELVLAKALRGWHIQGWAEDSDGAVIATVLDAVIGAPAADDTRTSAQRRAAALVALARMALDSGAVQPGASIRPHLRVHVGFDTLTALAGAQEPAERPVECAAECHPTGSGDQACEEAAPINRAAGDGVVVIPGELDHARLVGVAPGELDDGTPLPPAVLARLACDGELARVIFGPASEVLDVGRAQRIFPPGQRRAVIARDRHCQFPGCDAPPAQGEIHHSIWWYAHHGTTRVSDGVLLCWYHHAYVHANAITIVRDAAVNSPRRSAPTGSTGPGGTPRWRFYRRSGTEITMTDRFDQRLLRDSA